MDSWGRMEEARRLLVSVDPSFKCCGIRRRGRKDKEKEHERKGRGNGNGWKINDDIWNVKSLLITIETQLQA